MRTLLYFVFLSFCVHAAASSFFLFTKYYRQVSLEKETELSKSRPYGNSELRFNRVFPNENKLNQKIKSEKKKLTSAGKITKDRLTRPAQNQESPRATGLRKQGDLEDSKTTSELAVLGNKYAKTMEYPQMSVILGEEGSLKLCIKVSRGRVSEVSVCKEASSGYQRLDEAAVNAAKHWQFNSTSSGQLEQTVRFVLN